MAEGARAPDAPRAEQAASPAALSLRRNLVSVAILAGLALFLALVVWQGGTRYRQSLIAAEHSRLEALASSYIAGLSQSLNQRIGLVRGLAAYVTAEVADYDDDVDDNDKPASPNLQREFPLLAAGLVEAVEGIRNVAVAPEMEMQLVYPAQGNERLVGRRLADDERPGVAEMVERAIASRHIVILSPVDLVEGGAGIVLARAIFHDDRPWGLVGIAAELEPILTEAGVKEIPPDLVLGLYDHQGHLIAGKAATPDLQPVAHQLPLPDGRWELLLAPAEGWGAMVRTGMLSYYAATGAISLLLLALAGIALGYQSSLRRQVRAQTAALADSEAQARAARQQVVTAIETIPEGFALYDAEDRLVLYNERYRQIYAASAELIRPGILFCDMVRFGAERGQYAQAVGRVEEWVQERIQQHLSPGPPIEQRLGDGRWLRIEERRTADGGVVGIRSDITEIKQRELELAQQTDLLRATLAHMSEGISVFDRNLRLVAWNDRFVDLLGLPPTLVVRGTSLADILLHQARSGEFGPVDPETEAAHRLKMVQSPGLRITERRRPNGQVIELRRRSMPDGGYVTLYSDITARKETETALRGAKDAAEAATRAKSEFLAMMSHEIRTPMNGVIGMTSLLVQTPLSASQRRYAETIRTSAEALLLIINDILDFSKLEAGRLDLEISGFDPSEMVEGVVDLVAPQARAKGLEVQWLVAPEVPARLRGDSSRIRQILLNFLSNAAKFTTVGFIRTEVTLTARSPGRAQVRFAVSDSGIGIAAEAQTRLFQRFQQLDSSITRRYGGTGLGLAISRRLVELMGGEIGVDSALDQGSTFWFTLTLEEEPAAAAPSPPLPIDLPPLRILVVDDSDTNRHFFEALLERWGHLVTAVADAETALAAMQAAAAESRPYEVALIDHVLGRASGIELARRIRAEPRLAGTTLVLTSSAAPDEAPNHEAAASLFAGILMKPVQRAALADVLAAVKSRPGVEAPPTPPVAAAPAKRARILVVEDNVVNQQVAQAILEREGHHVDLAANGIEAVMAVAALPYDLVLMDVHMPEMDGYTATARIRSLGSGRGDIPIVALTASAMKEDIERCLACGMDDHLAKPVKRETLRQAVERWCGHRGSRDGDAPADAREGAPPAAPDFDPALVDEMRDTLGPASVGELVELFASDVRHHLAGAELAAAQGDTREARRHIHSLAGSASTYGLARLAALAQALDLGSPAAALDPPAARLAELAAAAEAGLAALTRHLADRAA